MFFETANKVTDFRFLPDGLRKRGARFDLALIYFDLRQQQRDFRLEGRVFNFPMNTSLQASTCLSILDAASFRAATSSSRFDIPITFQARSLRNPPQCLTGDYWFPN